MDFNGSGQWILDSQTSLCIDRGDPADGIGYEPNPNGGRINIGYDGGMMFASKGNGTGPDPGDPRMRRPYLSVVANPRRCPGVHYKAALKLQQFLCRQETQDWIARYGRGQLDDNSIFIPVGIQGTQPRQPGSR